MSLLLKYFDLLTYEYRIKAKINYTSTEGVVQWSYHIIYNNGFYIYRLKLISLYGQTGKYKVNTKWSQLRFPNSVGFGRKKENSYRNSLSSHCTSEKTPTYSLNWWSVSLFVC